MPGPCSAVGAGKPVIAPGPTVAGPAPDGQRALVLEYASKITAIDPTAARPVCAGRQATAGTARCNPEWQGYIVPVLPPEYRFIPHYGAKIRARATADAPEQLGQRYLQV